MSGPTEPTLTPHDRVLADAIAARTNAMVLDNLLELGLDGIVERIVERLRAPKDSSPANGAPRLVDARTVADALGCSRDCVYAHAAELGGQRIGDGPRGRLRFDLDHALSAWSACSTSKKSQTPQTPVAAGGSSRRRRQRLGSSPELLPIGGATDGKRKRS
jgi:hypothetical protein